MLLAWRLRNQVHLPRFVRDGDMTMAIAADFSTRVRLTFIPTSLFAQSSARDTQTISRFSHSCHGSDRVAYRLRLVCCRQRNASAWRKRTKRSVDVCCTARANTSYRVRHSSLPTSNLQTHSSSCVFGNSAAY